MFVWTKGRKACEGGGENVSGVLITFLEREGKRLNGAGKKGVFQMTGKEGTSVDLKAKRRKGGKEGKDGDGAVLGRKGQIPKKRRKKGRSWSERKRGRKE